MSVLLEAIVAILIVIGGTFLFIGSFGLAKLPDMMRRLHGPTKATTLGIGSLLLASIVYFALLHGVAGIHEILITLFLFLTAPVSAFMISKAYIFRHKDVQHTLPQPGNGSPWVTLDPTGDKARALKSEQQQG